MVESAFLQASRVTNSIGQYLCLSVSIEKEYQAAAELQAALGAGAEAEGVDTKLRLPTLKLPLQLR